MNTSDPKETVERENASQSPSGGDPSASTSLPPASQLTGSIPPDFFMHMMTMMQSMTQKLVQQQESGNKVKITDIFLPSYDPDGTVGVREWCDHISTAKLSYQLSDYDLRMKVTSLLKGRAKMWADSWLVTTSTWDELRQNIITTFEPESRYSRDILRFREHSYDQSKDISEFLSQSWLLWRRVTKDKLDSSDAVEAVIGTINDERLRIELMNARATSVPELISVASSIRKRPSQHNSNQTLHKRARLSLDNRTTITCSFCKKTGHTFNNCRSRLFSQTVEKNAPTPASGTPKPSGVKHCSFCSKPGHTFETCFRREKQISSNVNSVITDKTCLNTMKIQIGNLLLNAIFDSGAECSILRESVASKIPGRRSQSVKYLRGIGPFPVISTSALTAVCVIDSINVEI